MSDFLRMMVGGKRTEVPAAAEQTAGNGKATGNGGKQQDEAGDASLKGLPKRAKVATG